MRRAICCSLALAFVALLAGCGEELPPEEDVGGGDQGQAVSVEAAPKAPPCKPFQVSLLVANASSQVSRTCTAAGSAFAFEFASVAGPERRPVEFRFATETRDDDPVGSSLLDLASYGVGPATSRFLFDVVVPAAGDPPKAERLFREHLRESALQRAPH